MFSKRMDIELAIQALIVEVANLENIANQLELSDQQIIRECSIRINNLVLKKLNEDSYAYAS